MTHTSLRITITSSPGSWVQPHIERLTTMLKTTHEVDTCARHEDLTECDIAMYLSYQRIVPPEVLVRARSNIVVHESALPLGRGMSPMTWQVLEGAVSIPVRLLEAVQELDAGPIYLQRELDLEGNELLPELRDALGAATVEMCLEFVARFPAILGEGVPQRGEPTYYPRRRPRDSCLDPNRTLAEQFDLLRVVDDREYPAFFTHRNRTFRLTIEPMEDEP